MPLKKGRSKATVSANIKEFHTSETYAHTKAKFGKKRADKQAVAAALDQKRRSGGHVPKRGDSAKPQQHNAIGHY